MKRISPRLLKIGLGWLLVGLFASSGSPSLAQESAAKHALESIFNPGRAPAQKTMGLLQRSFLDLVEQTQTHLQCAFVIDGTTSMAADIEGVREALGRMVEDLNRYKQGQVEFQLVVYRDSGAPSGPVSVLLNDFTRDFDALRAAFAGITPESGAPYFHELADLGVHTALDKLNWRQDGETSRWVFLFADAPPFDSGFREAETGAERLYESDQLVQLARNKSIQLNCVLCTSRPEEKEAFESVLPATRRFMTQLASDSGGLMLDLSYPDIQKALEQAVAEQVVETSRIGRITREEIEQARAAANRDQTVVATNVRLRLAVLPHLPLNQMTFNPRHAAVQLATGIKKKFEQVPQVDIVSSVDLERRLRSLRRADLDDSQRIQALAGAVNADYLIWGSYDTQGDTVKVRSEIYSRALGAPVAQAEQQVSDKVPEYYLAGYLANEMIENSIQTNSQARRLPLGIQLVAYRNRGGEPGSMIRPVASSVPVHRNIMGGLEALEQALAMESGTAESIDKLNEARRMLLEATDAERQNPLSQLLLANCVKNLAAVALRNENPDEAKALMRRFVVAINQAYGNRSKAEEAVAKEINADYQLLVTNDTGEAIRQYEELAELDGDNNLRTALRATWMLAGIYSGDWDVPTEFQDFEKARQCLIRILAYWPESSEAQFIRRNLRWNEEDGENKFEYLPQPNDQVANLIET